jgi:DNA modification methylase
MTEKFIPGHPAKYSNSLLKPMTDILLTHNCITVLDPFAGTGKIHTLPFETWALEIEPEWAMMHPRTIIGDALSMPFLDGQFDAVCTSPTYGNRMADNHIAKDASKRITYTHRLGRKLSTNNSGSLQWGEKYKQFHHKAWKECIRVVKPNGLVIINISNHIRKGVEIDVTGWHIQEMILQGCILIEKQNISTPRMGFGANSDKRVQHESLCVFVTPKQKNFES